MAMFGYGRFPSIDNSRSTRDQDKREGPPKPKSATGPQGEERPSRFSGFTGTNLNPLKAVSSGFSSFKNYLSGGDQQKEGTAPPEVGMEEGKQDPVRIPPPEPQAHDRANQAVEGGVGEDWEDVTKEEAFSPLEQALHELEQLRAKQSSNLRKISELEQRARLAEADSRNKQKEIARIKGEHSDPRKTDTHTRQDDDSQVHKDTVEEKNKLIDDLQIEREQLKLEIETKEQQRNEATQKNIFLQNEVRVAKQDNHELKAKAEHSEMCHKQTMEEITQLETKVAELNKLMDAGPTTYIDGEETEDDVDERTVITQQQGRIKMLEEEVNQLRQLREHSKAQSREIHRLKQQQESFELQKSELESAEGLLHGLEGQVQQLTERLKTKSKEADDLKVKLELLEAQSGDSEDYGEHLRTQFERLKVQYNQLEQEHKQVLTSFTAMGQISGENSELRSELAEALAEVEKVQSALDSSEAQAMVYKSDFEEERKDRAAAHSKFADLEKEIAEQKNNFDKEIGTISEQLEHHKNTVDEFELVKEKLEEAVREARGISEEWRAEALQGREELLAKTSQVKAYKKQVDQLKADLEVKSQQVDKLTQNLGNLSEHLSAAQKTARKKDAKADKKKKPSTTDLGPVVTLDGLEKQLAAVEKRCDDLQSEKEKVEAKYRKSKEEVQHLTLEVKHLQASNEELTERVKHLENINVQLKGVMKQQTTQNVVENAVQKSCPKTTKEENTATGTGNFDGTQRDKNSKQRDSDTHQAQPPGTPTQPPVPANLQVPFTTNGNPPINSSTTAGTSNQQQHRQGNYLGSQMVQPSCPSSANQQGMHLQEGASFQKPYNQPHDGRLDQFSRNSGSNNGQYVERDGSLHQPEYYHSEPLVNQHQAPQHPVHYSQPQPQGVIQYNHQQQSGNNFQGGQAVAQQVASPTAPNSLVLGNQQQAVYSHSNMPASYPQEYGYQQNEARFQQGGSYQQHLRELYLPSSNSDSDHGYNYQQQHLNQQQQWVESQHQFNPDPTPPPSQQVPPVPRPRTHPPKHNKEGGANYQRQSSHDSYTDNTPLDPAGVSQDQPQASQQPPNNQVPYEKTVKDTRSIAPRNDLEQNIDQDIEEAAAEVTREGEIRDDAPLDPNLVCPMCMKQYRIGEIQLFKTHVGRCDGTSK